MFAEERRQFILEQLQKKRRVDVLGLAGKLDTSPETIRRDLNEMETDGILKRTHGGAIYLDDHTSRPLMPLHSRHEVNADGKADIARVAAGFVNDGDVIAIDNSTTTARIIEYIPADIKLTIVTYSMKVILDVIANPKRTWTCINLGGVVNPKNMSCHGTLTSSALKMFQPHKLFLSCAGIDSTGMMTEGNLLEAEIKRELLQSCRKSFLLADGSKWGQVGPVNEGQAANLDYLITNADVAPEKLAILRGKKVRIIFDR